MEEPSDNQIRRSPLEIDLNEIPPTPLYPDIQALAVVRTFCYIYPAQGPPAGFPGPTDCSVCSMSIDCASPPGLVCDACERGFHLACCPDMPEIDTVSLADCWRCGECVDGGVLSKRWPLGRSGVGRNGVVLLDINALPASDGEGEASDDSSKRIHCDILFGGNTVGAVPAIRTSSYHQGNIIDFNKASWTKMHDSEPHLGKFSHRSKVADMSVGRTETSFPRGSFGSNDDTVQTQKPSETFLLALREFINEQHGDLTEGWRAEVRTLPGNNESYAVYYSPEGKVFESMSEVACFLGLMSEGNPGTMTSQKKMQSKKRKFSKQFLENGCAENIKNRAVSKDASFGVQGTGLHSSRFQDYDPDQCKNGDSDWQQFNDDLPIQYEDFFILSLGKVDKRPSYHDSCHIWPIGYKSCWHDKMTGSLFICEVVDGGDEGPVFKVRRCSCSAIPIPVGSSVVCLSNLLNRSDQNEEYFGTDYDHEDIIQQLLLDPCPPLETEISLCLSNNSCENPSFFDLEEERSFKLPDCNSELIDEIGELSHEGRVLSSVWKFVCCKLVEAVCEIYKRTGDMKAICHHFVYKPESHSHDSNICVSEDNYASLKKLHGSLGLSKLKSLILLDGKVETLSDILTKWLELDRFGLDVQFVQEIIEQLPGISAFSDYSCLGNRKDLSMPLTIKDGFLIVRTKNGIVGHNGEKLDTLLKGHSKDGTQQSVALVREAPRQPLGKPIGTVLPPTLIGDILQVMEFLCRFHEILGLDEPLSFEELEKELMCPWLNCSDLTGRLGKELTGIKEASLCGTGVTDHTNDEMLFPTVEYNTAVCNKDIHASIPISTEAMRDDAHAKLVSKNYLRFAGEALTRVHCSILKVVITELLSKVALVVDPYIDTGEHKSKRGKKRDAEGSVFSRKKLSILPVSEYTWPEVARRYILAAIGMDGNVDSTEISNGESAKLFRCLQGDGGVFYGSLTGIAGMEGDALLLAEARKKVFSSLKQEDSILSLEEEIIGPSDEGETLTLSDTYPLPDWALVLEPVRKLPTNVGTRIRNRVNEALSKDPPEWARDILLHSISKEVYKGNASGPTKKAVISVLDSLKNEAQSQRPTIERKRQNVISIQTSNIIVNQCRIILRRAAAEDDARMFCNLLGRKIMNSNDNGDEGLLGSPAMVSRPLDFRTIDLRLAVGAYDGSQDSFLEDVKELWNNVRTVFTDQPELMVAADALFTNFEVMYEKEVIPLVERLKAIKMDCSSDESKKELKDIISSTAEIPKAPWDDGVCKICGIDKDDDSVLLCDACDAEYHRYCLNPPLAKIPEGNWYCPSCLNGKADSSTSIHIVHHVNKKKQGEYNCHQLELLSDLATSMEENEYWELDVHQRVFLLKFLCDELLNTAFIRQHLEHCAEISLEMQQKLRSMSNELKNLKVKKDILMTRAAKVERFSNGISEDFNTAAGSDYAVKKHGRNVDLPLGDKKKCISFLAVDRAKPGNELESAGINNEDKKKSVHVCDKLVTSDIDLVQNINTGDVLDVPVGSAVQDHHNPSIDASKDHSPLGTINLLSPSSQLDNAGNLTEPNLPECKGKDRNKMSAHLSSPDFNNTDAIESSSHTVTEANEDDGELNAIKREILVLQESMMGIESQILDQNIRREFLGCDFVLQLYWVSTRTGRPPWVIVDRSMAMQHGNKFRDPVKLKVDKLYSSKYESGSTPVNCNKTLYICGLENHCNFSPWVSYQSDDDIAQLVDWLTYNPKDRELRESILHLQRLRINHNSTGQNAMDREPALLRYSNKESSIYPDSLATRALSHLRILHRSRFDAGNNKSSKNVRIKSISKNEGKMHRCDCLEVILHSRHHCFTCHRTFCSNFELAEHMDGNCFVDGMDFDNHKSITNSVKMKKDVNSEAPTVDRARERGIIECVGCPFDLKEICSKFRTTDSNIEVVKGIGLIGSNGVPSFVYIYSPYLSDPALALAPQKLNRADFAAGDATGQQVSRLSDGIVSSTLVGRSPTTRRTCCSFDFERPLRCSKKDNNHSLNNVTFASEGSHGCVISQSSLRPVADDKFQLFTHLKINLLDMEAALPDEAFKASKALNELRWAWRAFVKSTHTIFEMVQATIVLEDMIKAEHLKHNWWYWSSLTAAAKVSTLSSLALRIYALDAAIIYDKGSDDINAVYDNNDQTQLFDSVSSDKTKSSRRFNKKRREVEA